MNIESNTLLEKLNIINQTKKEIRKAIIEIGGTDYINEDTMFEDYPQSIRNTHSNIQSSCRMLEATIYGDTPIESIVNGNLRHADMKGYMYELQECKADLIYNLNLKGVNCTANNTLRELVDMVTQIETNNYIEPEREFIREVSLDNGVILKFYVYEEECRITIETSQLTTGEESSFIARIYGENGNSLITYLDTDYGHNGMYSTWWYNKEFAEPIIRSDFTVLVDYETEMTTLEYARNDVNYGVEGRIFVMYGERTQTISTKLILLDDVQLDSSGGVISAYIRHPDLPDPNGRNVVLTNYYYEQDNHLDAGHTITQVHEDYHSLKEYLDINGVDFLIWKGDPNEYVPDAMG